jgi:hypothetical protein
MFTSRSSQIFGKTFAGMKRTVITELDSAIELSTIALESDNKEKIARLRESARKAYSTGLHFMATTTLTQAEELELLKKLGSLKRDLVALGERF